MRTTRRRWLVIALAGLAGACGGGGDDAAPTTTTSAPITPATNTAVDTTPADTTVPPTTAPPTTAAPSTTGVPGGNVVVDPRPGTSTTPATTAPAVVEPVDVGLVLRPDGLGPAVFDMNIADTLAVLEAALGPADYLGEARFEPAIGSLQSVSWGGLTVQFTGGASQMYFTSYDFSRPYDSVADDTGEYRMELTEWEPAGWELGLTTDDGIGLGTPAADAAAAYPEVYAAECDGSTTPTSLLIGDESMWQMFVEPQQSGLYLQRPVDGVVWWIGAQVARNPMACDGA